MSNNTTGMSMQIELSLFSLYFNFKAIPTANQYNV